MSEDGAGSASGTAEPRRPLALVADDEAEVRQLIGDVLAEVGVETLTARDGLEQSLEQALRNLVMQGRIDRAHAEGFLQSSSSGSSGTLGPAAAVAAAGR